MQQKVLVTWIDYDLDGPQTGRRLRAAGLEPVWVPKTGARSAQETADLARDAVAAIVSTDPFDASVFEVARDLRVIARVGVGVDSIDLAAATRAGVAVSTTPDANKETVADHTLALMLAVLRRVVEHDAGVRRGDWNRAGAMTAWDLNGATVGLVGFGSIGRAVARRLRGFGVRILVFDVAPKAVHGATSVSLDELLASCDVVSLHAPLTPATHHLLGARELALLQPNAVLVNTSRGGLVDEEALVRRLESGDLRGAALDVFEVEPPVASRLLQLPNVVLSPHIAGLSAASIATMTARATASVIGVLDGSDTSTVVNPRALRLQADAGAVRS